MAATFPSPNSPGSSTTAVDAAALLDEMASNDVDTEHSDDDLHESRSDEDQEAVQPNTVNNKADVNHTVVQPANVAVTRFFGSAFSEADKIHVGSIMDNVTNQLAKTKQSSTLPTNSMVIMDASGTPVPVIPNGQPDVILPLSATMTETNETGAKSVPVMSPAPVVPTYTQSELEGAPDDEVDWNKVSRRVPTLMSGEKQVEQAREMITSLLANVPNNIPKYQPSKMQQLLGNKPNGGSLNGDDNMLSGLISQMNLQGASGDQAKNLFTEMFSKIKGVSAPAEPVRYTLSMTGQRVLDVGSPEYLVWKLIDSAEETSLSDFRFLAFPTKSELMGAVAHAIKRQWIVMDKTTNTLKRVAKDVKDECKQALVNFVAKDPETRSSVPAQVIQSLLARKFIESAAASNTTPTIQATASTSTRPVTKSTSAGPVTPTAPDKATGASGPDKAASGSDKAASGPDKAASGSDKAPSGPDKAASGSDNAASGIDKAASGSDKAAASGPDKAASASGTDKAGASGPDKAAVLVDTTIAPTPTNSSTPSSSEARKKRRKKKASSANAGESTAAHSAENGGKTAESQATVEAKLFETPVDSAVDNKDAFNRNEAKAALKQRRQMKDMGKMFGAQRGMGQAQINKLMGSMGGVSNWARQQQQAAAKEGKQAPSPETMAEGSKMLSGLANSFIPKEQRPKVQQNLPSLLNIANDTITKMFGGGMPPAASPPTSQVDEDIIHQSIQQTAKLSDDKEKPTKTRPSRLAAPPQTVSPTSQTVGAPLPVESVTPSTPHPTEVRSPPSTANGTKPLKPKAAELRKARKQAKSKPTSTS